jgi:SsrA-binding protein
MKIINKKAKFNYRIFEEFEAGIALTGAEAKTAKLGRVDLTNSYVKIVNGEAFLINTNIISDNVKNPTRTRKLLLHKRELVSIATKAEAKNLTIVPIAMYNKARLVKVKFALAKSKREYEKREIIKKRQDEIEKARELRYKNLGDKRNLK